MNTLSLTYVYPAVTADYKTTTYVLTGSCIMQNFKKHLTAAEIGRPDDKIKYPNCITI